MKTLADLHRIGRDPFIAFRADEALALDADWLARVLAGGELAFWDDDAPSTDPECPPYDIQGGVAVYEVEGPLVQRGWYCFQGYDTVARDLEMALADTRVRSVLLRMNTPGGVCAGCFEGSRRMRQLVEASGKRVVAFADEMAYSAGYSLACVADEIVLPEPGGVGSVGVIGGLMSQARALEKAGFDVKILTSGREKADGHPALPLSAEVIARAQARIDALATMFQRWVADRRGMSIEAVKGLEAGVRYGRDAVASGLANRVASFHELVGEMRERAAAQPGTARASTSARTTRAASTPTTATTRNSTMNEMQLAALAAATGETDHDKIVAAVTALKTRASAAEESITKLSADVALSNDRAAAAEKRLDAADRAREIDAAKAEGKWSPALEGFLATLATAQLAGWRAAAPRVVPGGEHRPPTDGPQPDAQLPPDLAEIAAKASANGWKSLSDSEKDRLYRANKPLALRLKAAGTTPAADA